MSQQKLFKMKTIDIKNIKGEVIYTHTCEKNSIKTTLEEAVKENAYLREADLREADLGEAYLIEANLGGAYLGGAYLGGANLIGANLGGAYLIGAYLTEANLSYCNGYYSFVAYDTSKRIVHCIEHDKTWMVKAGCFWGTLEELEERVLKTHKSKVYLQNIELLKTL